MKKNLRPLYIKAAIEGKCIGRILVDGGATINLPSLTILDKLGKNKEELRNTNMVVTDYHGKTSLVEG